MSSSEVNLENYLIPLEEVNLATKNFSPERYIGGGGFGKVYKGELSERWQNRTAAFKRLAQNSYQGEHEFRNEISMISRFHHENIISFIGYCDEVNEMIVVYEYAINGSLDHHLQDPNKRRDITWTHRLKICIGAARGLNYLHSGLGEHNRVIHRDVKSANILLDDNFVAKICDFGLSKLGPKNLPNTHLDTKVAGTQFYLDPTYHESHILRKESDIYSFGVVLFEMLSGMLVYSERSIEDNRPKFLMNLVRRYDDNQLHKLIDPHMRDQISSRSLDMFKGIAYQCISFNLKERPGMEAVIARIEEALAIQSLEYAEEVKGEAQESFNAVIEKTDEVREEPTHEFHILDMHEDLELDSTTSTESNTKMESTTIEGEAIAMGLQTIKKDDLEEISQLESGSTYRVVYHGMWKGTDVAIKRIKGSCFARKSSETERMINNFWKEALVLSSLHHPNVVTFYGIVRDEPDDSLTTVTEYMVDGSLKQFLKKKDRTIDQRERLIIAMDTASGMDYLHGKNVVHFDLRCENLLVNMRDPHRPICKIGDLRLSKIKRHNLVNGDNCGTVQWMAPELLNDKSHLVTAKVDVYSFGVVMWELLTGDEPYNNMHHKSIIGGIIKNTLRPVIPTWCDAEWKSLMESCWSSDPQERLPFSEISQKLRTMVVAMNVK
ncbi:unnamed protein product [Lactuca virosa]|uniref:Protein kinase domain-containing protein n=1 Tax=Lactuca virosa TaxID=75947 RepID=A0AAU9NRK2_9ASTR|nr:unnamed protein product [Lactuca virosa]